MVYTYDIGFNHPIWGVEGETVQSSMPKAFTKASAALSLMAWMSCTKNDQLKMEMWNYNKSTGNLHMGSFNYCTQLSYETK